MMKRVALVLGGAATLIGGGAFVAAKSEGQGEYYAIPRPFVEDRLARLAFGAGELGPGERLKLVLRSRSPDMLRWDLIAEGRRFGDARAYLTPDGAGTRVRVKFAFTDGQLAPGLTDRSFVNEVAEIMMDEKVDSALEGRAFDRAAVEARIEAAVVANPEAAAELEEAIAQREQVRNRWSHDPWDEPRDAPPSSRPSPARPPDVSETHADGGWGKN